MKPTFRPTTLILIASFLIACIGEISAQQLESKMDSLYFFGDVMSNARMDNHRLFAAEHFYKTFEDLLNEDPSLEELIDIPFISSQVPKDSSFVLFTWRLASEDQSEFYYFGHIFSPTNEFAPIALHDRMGSGRITQYSTQTPDNWPAAFYYNIRDFELPDGQTAYLLFGINEYSRFNRIRIMDVLYREGNNFYFGYPVFGEDHASMARRGKTRIMMKYSYDAPVFLNYDSEYELIVMNVMDEMEGIHPNQGITAIPSGEYHGYRYEDGYWIYVPEIVRVRSTPNPGPPPETKKRTGPRRDLFGRPMDDNR